MVVYNYTGKEINAKVVYYGPALSGKTTNLEWIYSKIPVEYSGKMVSLRTQADRTIFFDFLPLDLGVVDGFRTRFMLYTVPGQVHYNATRKMVLKGVDGVVFVADSEPSRMRDNVESLENLRENLRELGIDPDSIPVVLQWNKRDLPNSMEVMQLEKELNPEKFASFESCALTGEGVYETLHALCQLIYRKLSGDVREGVEESSTDGASLFGETIAQCLQEVDERPSEPLPLELEAEEETPSSTTEADDASVLAAILGGRPQSEPSPTYEGDSDSGPKSVELDLEADSRELVGVAAGHGEAEAQGRQRGASASPPRSGPPSQPGTSAPLGEALDGHLGQESRNEEPPAAEDESRDPDPPGDSPDIEHPADIIADMQAQRPESPEETTESPRASGPSGGQEENPVGPGIDLDVILGEQDSDSAPSSPRSDDSGDDLRLIQDPRRLPEQRASGVSGSTPIAESGSTRGFSTPATRSRVLEVPVTVDSSVFEEGRSLRIVLNVSVKNAG